MSTAQTHSESVGKIAEAIVAVQRTLVTVLKTDEVNAGKKRYRFAPLRAIVDMLRPKLAEHGLAIVQLVHVHAEGGPVLVSELLHTSGEWVRAVHPLLGPMHDAQAMGSAITYARRYSLCALLGVVTDEDDDGAAASGYMPPPPPPPPPPPAPAAPQSYSTEGLIEAMSQPAPPLAAWVQSARECTDRDALRGLVASARETLGASEVEHLRAVARARYVEIGGDT